jgi:hypothetical protein
MMEADSTLGGYRVYLAFSDHNLLLQELQARHQATIG